MKIVIAILAVIVSLTGCGKHYYGKPDGSLAEFTRDNSDCARAAASATNPDRTAGIVNLKMYRYCMKARGWERDQKQEPVPFGWFRGVEDDDEIVSFATPPEQPGSQRPSSIPRPNPGRPSDFGRK